MNIWEQRIKQVQEELDNWRWLYKSVGIEEQPLVARYGRERQEWLQMLQKTAKFWKKR